MNSPAITKENSVILATLIIADIKKYIVVHKEEYEKFLRQENELAENHPAEYAAFIRKQNDNPQQQAS